MKITLLAEAALEAWHALAQDHSADQLASGSVLALATLGPVTSDH